MFFVYILYSSSADKYYVGYSDDPTRRLFEHNHNYRNTFAKKNGPWILKAQFPVNGNRGDAMKMERHIKKQKSRNLIAQMIVDPEIFCQMAQLVRVPFRGFRSLRLFGVDSYLSYWNLFDICHFRFIRIRNLLSP